MDQAWFQTTRNHCDRVMHLLCGLQAILSTSASYEIIEWTVAASVNPEIGTEFVGAQGDPWDAEKDMALALGGSLAVTLGLLGWRRRLP